jgi:chorismate mutase
MNLEHLRSKIDSIDDSITILLIERLGIVKQIGDEKKRLNIALKDNSRERIVLSNIERTARTHNLNRRETAALVSIYQKIMEEAVKLESD